MMESFWGTMQLVLLDRKAWKSRKELANAIFEWIECWYNPKRRHSSLGMLSPADYETRLRPPDHSADPTPEVSGERGQGHRQIARALFISEKTASVHVTNLLRKLGVTSHHAAAAAGARAGISP